MTSEVSKVIITRNNIPLIEKAISGDALLRAARAGGHVIEAAAKINIMSGRSGLRTRSSNLAGSIIVEDAEVNIENASVNVGPTVIYGRIQELGGIILPIYKKLLSWVEDGIRIFANVVKIPAHPYLRPAADEQHQEILDAVGYQLKDGIEKAAQ